MTRPSGIGARLVATATTQNSHQQAIKTYRPGVKVRPNHVIHVNNRPSDADRPHLFHDKIQSAYRELKRLEREGKPLPDHLPTEFVTNKKLRRLVETGLANGRFKDTTHINHWLDKMNRYIAGFKRQGIDELQLMEVHAGSHIEALTEEILGNNHYPAGIILSGSSLMMTDAKYENETVKKIMELVRDLGTDIPILGICFGMHLLTEVFYGSEGDIVDWLTVPKGMGYKLRESDLKPVPVGVRPGERQPVIGRTTVQWTGPNDPLSRFGHKTDALELHFQHVPYPHMSIPNEAVLARSARTFLPTPDAPESAWVTEYTAEIICFGGRVYGTQLHPELTPDLLIALTYLPEYRDLFTKSGLDVGQIREDLSTYPHPLWAGQRYGYNWVEYVLLVDYIERLLDDHEVSSQKAAYLDGVLRSLEDKNPALYNNVGALLIDDE
ncbi:MAG: hypothetical protein HQM16_17010 [Deltaproteobacteria bacterium]|nr:hypothetical protein [Deltaproteobacteria bacterium]